MFNELSSKLLGPIIASSDRSSRRQLLYHRVIVLVLTFLVYTTYHASRKPLSIVNGELHRNCSHHHHYNVNLHIDVETTTAPTTTSTTTTTPSPTTTSTTTPSPTTTSTTTPSPTTPAPEPEDCGWAPFDKDNGKKLLGMLDTIYLSMYAIGLFCMGYIAERSNLRAFLPLMMCIIGVIPIAFGLARTFNIHSLWYFIVLQILGGFAQASGWPSVVAVVGAWFGSTKKGLILGIWNWHTSVGNIVGILIAGYFVETNWGLSFIVPGGICIAVGLLVFIFLIPKPSQVGIRVDFISPTEDEIAQQPEQQQPRNRSIYRNLVNRIPSEERLLVEDQELETRQGVVAITVWQAFCIPGVIEFAICLFFSKLVSYTFQFWLPLYLDETGHVAASTGAFRSIVFDLGGCLGSLLAGLLADRIDACAITCIVFLVLSIPSLYSFNLFVNASITANQVLQFIAGVCVNGPYALITTAVSANLGCKVPTKSALATVSGIIDGIGSIGAAVGPMIAALLTGPNNQWNNVFYMCIGADVLAILSLLRVAWGEFRRLRRN